MKKLFTIGYGGLRPAEFVFRLREAGVRTVVDVRLRPDRACLTVFKRTKSPEQGIEALLREAGIGYCSCVELGNVFMDDEAFPEWRRLYAELLRRAGDMLAGRLEHLQAPLCLLCCERDVQHCHRQQIAEYLSATQGFQVEHL